MNTLATQELFLTPEQIDNPLTIETDDECLKILHTISLDPRLTSEDLKLLIKAMSVMALEDGATVDFNLFDLFELSNLAERFLDYSDQIRACSDYLSTLIDYQFNLPTDIDPTTLCDLNTKLTQTYINLQSILFGLDPSEFLNNNDSDESQRDEGDEGDDDEEGEEEEIE